MKKYGYIPILFGLSFLMAATAVVPVAASGPPGADLVDLAYSKEQGIAVLSRYELFRSRDGVDWAPAGFSDRLAALSAVGLGRRIVLVASVEGLIFRSVEGGAFQKVQPPKDPYGRNVTSIRVIAVHPRDSEILASSGQGVLRSRDMGATWEAIADPFWSNPDAREVMDVGYVDGKPLVITRGGPYRQSGEKFEPVTRGLPETVRPTATAIADGQALMALPGEGIFLAKKDNKWAKLRGDPGDPIAFTGFARKGYLAARPTTTLNLSDGRGKTWTPVGQYAASFIPVDSVTTPYGDFLALRGKGLVRIEEDRFLPVGLPANLSAVNARIVVEGKQLAGTQGGVYVSTSAGRQWLDVTPPALGAAVNLFLPLGDGRILLGSEGAGVFVSENGGESWRSWNIRLGTANTIKGLVRYGGGVLAGTENGLMWTEAQAEASWQRRDGGVGRTSVAALIKEGDTYWLATQTGVYTAEDKGDFTPVPGFAGRAAAIAVEKGRVLAVVDGKIFLADKGKKPSQLSRTPDRAMATSVALRGGTPYVGTNKGLYTYANGSWSRVGVRTEHVDRLVADQGGVRVVTRGAGTYLVK